MASPSPVRGRARQPVTAAAPPLNQMVAVEDVLRTWGSVADLNRWRARQGANLALATCGREGEAAMEWVIQLECRLGEKVLHRRDVATLSRESTPLRPEHVRL